MLLLLVPLLVLSLAPPSRPRPEEPPPWWHDLDGARLIIPEDFYERRWRSEIAPDDRATVLDLCGRGPRVLRPGGVEEELRASPDPTVCPKL